MNIFFRIEMFSIKGVFVFYLSCICILSYYVIIVEKAFTTILNAKWHIVTWTYAGDIRAVIRHKLMYMTKILTTDIL